MAKKKHAIVTGGAGFIGSHLCDALLKKGYAVTAIDNFVTGRRSNLKQCEGAPDFHLLEWDVSKPIPRDRLPALSSHGLSAVLHFACPASPVDFDRIPFEILLVDSAGTQNTVELAWEHDARYILASTSEVYGDPLVHPQPETYWGNVNTIGHRSCYDETKRFAEAFVSSAWGQNPAASGETVPYLNGQKKRPLNAGIVRIFNTYGPRMRLDDGRVVPELCKQALEDKPLSIHGSGKQTRSFCYVSDLVDGIIRMLESSQRTVINLGNPTEQSILDFARVLSEVSGKSLEVQYGQERPDDPKRRRPDISRARELLGWEPRVSIREGLQSTFDSFKRDLGGRS